MNAILYTAAVILGLLVAILLLALFRSRPFDRARRDGRSPRASARESRYMAGAEGHHSGGEKES